MHREPLTRSWLCKALLVLGSAHLLFAQTQSVTDLLNQGTVAAQRGDLAQAETIFQRATVQAPDFSDAFLGAGLVQLRRGEIDSAIASLRRATELNARITGAHLFLGIAEYQAGQSEAARDSLHSELALDPNSVEALRWLGIVTLELGHPEESAVPLDRLATLRPKDPQVLYYQAKAHGALAKSALGKLYAIDPDSALVHRALAESLDESGESEKAVAEFQSALRKEPENADLLEELGNEDQKLSRFNDAAAAYSKELSVNPGSAIALYNLGKISVESGKAAESISLLRRAQAAHASASPTDYYLGLGLAETGQNEEAAHWLLSALSHDAPPFVQQGAWYQLARVYGKLGRKTEQQDALTHLRQVLEVKNREKEATAGAARAQTPQSAPRLAGQP